MITHKALERFARYMSVGMGTFAFDLLLLWLFKEVFGMHYLLAAGIAFTIAVSLNYLISRQFVFKHSERTLVSGYFFFIGIAACSVALTLSLMWALVEFLSLHYIVARVFVAGIVGQWNYFLNLYLNFRVAGKEF